MNTPPADPLPQFLASDNYAGICPEAWQALEEANRGHAPAYGEDHWTREVSDRIRELFETDCEVYFVFSGTAANSLSLASTCRSYHSIVCHELAHIETYECGAPEFFSNGTKVLLAPGEHAKLTPEGIEEVVLRRTDIHYPKPRAVSLTQATEMGTVYTVEELRAIWAVTRKHNLSIQMDGARFANAVQSLGAAPKEITWQAGVDVLCFGGTKNGLPVGDAVVFFNRELAAEFDFRCKQAGQLCSKMRFMSAPWLGLLAHDAWLRHAGHGNAMATRLRTGLQSIPGIEFLAPTQANMVFVVLPHDVIRDLHQAGWHFYVIDKSTGCRLVCAWDTSEATVDGFVAAVKKRMGAG